MLERTVTKLIECPYTGKVLGVRAVNKTNSRRKESKRSFTGI
jgi:hypothetical protein